MKPPNGTFTGIKEGIWPSKNSNPCSGKKVPFWQFFRKGWDGCALLVQPSKINAMRHKNSFCYKFLSTYRKTGRPN
jgi:hypothetical protein